MKRLLLIAAILLTAVTAQAQISFYGEIWEDRPGGKLKSKNWTADGHFRQETSHSDGTTNVVIYRADSLKYWMLNPAKKTAMTMPKSQMNTNAVIGMKVEDGRNVTRKLLGLESVEGYECEHYEITTVTRMANGTEQRNVRYEWVYPPLGSWLRYEDGERLIMRNWAVGPQPASLFVVPGDYAVRANPLSTEGGIMGIIRSTTGKSDAEIKQTYDDTNSEAKSEMEKLEATRKDASKTDEQKLIEMLNQMGGVLNKKK